MLLSQADTMSSSGHRGKVCETGKHNKPVRCPKPKLVSDKTLSSMSRKLKAKKPLEPLTPRAPDTASTRAHRTGPPSSWGVGLGVQGLGFKRLHTWHTALMKMVRTDRPSTVFLFFQKPMSFLKASMSKTSAAATQRR